jgi:hypothetical protein
LFAFVIVLVLRLRLRNGGAKKRSQNVKHQHAISVRLLPADHGSTLVIARQTFAKIGHTDAADRRLRILAEQAAQLGDPCEAW